MASDTETDPETGSESAAKPGPGSRLKAAREGMEASAREVADALNLPVRVIEALEADDYDRLPPSVFTRGYLRSYARLLELPADELLALYPEVQAEQEPLPPEESGPGFSVPIDLKKLLPVLLGALIVVIAGVALLFSGDDVEDGADVPEAALVESDRDAPELDGEERGEETIGTDEVEAAAPAPDTPGTPLEPEGPAAAAGEPSTAQAPPSPETADQAGDVPGATTAVPAPAGRGDSRLRRITELGDDRLTFTFEQECWLEVKSLEGDNLYSNLLPAGRTLELVGQGPFRVLVGFAPGVTLSFNGEPVPLAAHTRNNVATLTLGQ